MRTWPTWPRTAASPRPGSRPWGRGGDAVDTQAMSDLNVELLTEINVYGVGTPTVYDLVNDEVLDIDDDDWLSKLIATI